LPPGLDTEELSKNIMLFLSFSGPSADIHPTSSENVVKINLSNTNKTSKTN
jgi:hypothetical protein